MAACMITFDGAPYTVRDLKNVQKVPGVPSAMLELDIYEDSNEIPYFEPEVACEIADYLAGLFGQGSPCSELISVVKEKMEKVEYLPYEEVRSAF